MISRFLKIVQEWSLPLKQVSTSQGTRGTGTLMNRWGKSTTSMVGYPLLSRSGRLRLGEGGNRGWWWNHGSLIFSIFIVVGYWDRRKQVSASNRHRKEVVSLLNDRLGRSWKRIILDQSILFRCCCKQFQRTDQMVTRQKEKASQHCHHNTSIETTVAAVAESPSKGRNMSRKNTATKDRRLET